MYIYVNTTEAALQENFTKLFELQERIRNGTGQNRLMPGGGAHRLHIIWKNKRSNTNHVKSSPRLPKAQKSRDADWIFIPQKPSLFLLSCSHSLQTTWMGQRSTPLTPLCVCSWKGSAALRRWRNAEKPAYWSDWSGSPWRSTTRYGEGECERRATENLRWSRVWMSHWLHLSVLKVLDDSHCDEEPGGGPASPGAADEGGCLRQP